MYLHLYNLPVKFSLSLRLTPFPRRPLPHSPCRVLLARHAPAANGSNADANLDAYLSRFAPGLHVFRRSLAKALGSTRNFSN